MGRGTNRRCSRFVIVFISGCIFSLMSSARAAATSFSDAEQIEVREGDGWSAATIVKHEGRKYLIHYNGADASTDEWVAADRMRLPGTAPATNPAAPQTRPAAKKLAQFNTGEKL